MMTKQKETVSQQNTETLAQRVQRIRESLGITQSRLAELASMPLSQIQDIESGIELFMSPAVRQKLARGLKIRPNTLKAVERHIPAESPVLSLEAQNRYIEEILHFPDEEHPCPLCRAPLIVRLFQRKDLEENPLVEVKAHCSQCLFKL